MANEDEKAPEAEETSPASHQPEAAPPKPEAEAEAAAAGEPGEPEPESGKQTPLPEREQDADEDEEQVASAPSSRPAPAPAPRRAPAHAHAADAHAHDDHGLAHVTPVRLLVGVLAALLVLTVITVLVTKVDLGGQWNLVVAMVIATIKAGLVVAYFMHLRWDKLFHTLVFLSSVLFLILFLALALTDRQEYQPNIDLLEQQQAQSGG
jgi:cytochrome c oxidase subunit IV